MITDEVFDDPQVAALLDLALREDLGDGDRTSEATVPADVRARGRVLAKEDLVVCGVPLIGRVFARLGGARVDVAVGEGENAPAGTAIATVEGPARTLLAGERLVLNLLQHLCGVATFTRRCVDAVAGTPLVVRDTRKTLPGMRLLAKYAVRTGGGTNHRLRLDDAMLIKDNHIDLGGGDVASAVAAARKAFPDLPLEIEARTLDEVERALAAGPDMILLDNMSIFDMADAARLVAGKVPLEASGGIEFDDLPTVARTGVQYVSLGALTHSAPAADLSLKLERVR